MVASEEPQAGTAASSAALEAIVANAPLALFVLDRDGIFTFSDGQELAVLGLRPGQLVGASVFQVWSNVPALVAQARRARVDRPWRRRARHTPLADSRSSPHRDWASSAAIRAGPKPGWPRAKATTRCSTSTLV
jgi:PAS domain-containing protein